MNKEETIEKLLSEVKTEKYPQQVKVGGQSVGVPLYQGIKLTCSVTDFEVCVSHYRSSLQNANLALELYKIYLEKTL